MASKRDYELAGYLDVAYIRPTDTKRDIINLCRNAIKYRFHSVCVPPCYVKLAKKILKGRIGITAVIGFPLGTTTTETKVFETKQAIKNGADEIDMVMNIAMFKSKDYDYVLKDINSVARAARRKIVKVIIETGYLNEKEIKKAASIVKKSDADFIKTSTGFKGGAKVKDIILIKSVVKDKVRIKASGGIRTRRKALDMIKVGASRIGTRSWQIILE